VLTRACLFVSFYARGPVGWVAQKVLDPSGVPIDMMRHPPDAFAWDHENSNLRRVPCSVRPRKI